MESNKQLGGLFRGAVLGAVLLSADTNATGYDDRYMAIVANVQQNPQFNTILHDARCTRGNGYRYLLIRKESRAETQGCWYYSAQEHGIVYAQETGQRGVWRLELVEPVKGVNIRTFTHPK